MPLPNEAQELLNALQAEQIAPAHDALVAKVLTHDLDISAASPGAQNAVGIPGYKALFDGVGLQKGSTARLQEILQAWPNAAKHSLHDAILHQVI